jgi:hypothetical protein
MNENKYYLEGMSFGLITASIIGFVFLLAVIFADGNISGGFGIFGMLFFMGILSQIVSKVKIKEK